MKSSVPKCGNRTAAVEEGGDQRVQGTRGGRTRRVGRVFRALAESRGDVQTTVQSNLSPERTVMFVVPCCREVVMRLKEEEGLSCSRSQGEGQRRSSPQLGSDVHFVP